MNIRTFPDNRAYRRAQRNSDARKNDNETNMSEEEANVIANHYESDGIHPVNGICHGARMGQEMNMLSHRLRGDFFGTDLWKREGRKDVVAWDFRKPKPEWNNRFTFLYSNSLDHTDCPIHTLRLWMSQLCDDGLMFVQWTHWHQRQNMGDCFTANMGEYVNLMNAVGKVRSILWLDERDTKVVIVTEKRQGESESWRPVWAAQ